jgi:polar amino acid transport system substrate-binding protein
MKKFLALALAAVCVISVLSLSSCKSTTTTATASGSSAATSSAPKVLTVGVDDTYPPMEFTDTTGTKIVGFDMDLANEVGKRMGMTVKIEPITWNGIFAGLESKKFDCIISSVSMTPDRIQKYDFTKPYIANAQMIVVKKGDNSITTQDNLAGKNVGCQIQTTANDSATALMKSGVKLNLTTYDQIIECFQALSANRIQAVIVDEVVGEYYIKQSPDKYQAAAVKLTNEPIGVCFRKDEATLRNSMQTQLDAMTSDGTMKSISMKWFGQDLTSNIDTKLRMLS